MDNCCSKRWVVNKVEQTHIRSLVENLGISEPVARVLAGRGFITPHSAKLFLEPKLEDLVKDAPPPPEFEELRCENMCLKLGLTSDLNQVAGFVHEAISILTKSRATNQEITLSEIIDISRQNANKREGGTSASNRLINTILKSKTIKDINGSFILNQEDSRKLYASVF